MPKCKDCKYAEITSLEIKGKKVAACRLTNTLVDPEIEHECPYHNKDLSEYDICYNCRYYIGGGDWGLFCSHKDMYYHLGKFNDKPCEFYERNMKLPKQVIFRG